MFLPGDCHWKNDQTLGDRMKVLLSRALEAHGGLSRWREIEAFQLKVSIGGGLWRLKGLPDGLHDVTLRIQEVNNREQHTEDSHRDRRNIHEHQTYPANGTHPHLQRRN